MLYMYVCVCVRVCIYKVCPEGIQPCNMKNRDIYWRRYKIQETLYIGQWHLSPLQSRHLGTFTQFSQLPSVASSYFPEYHRWSEISCLLKMILVLGKARSCQVPNLGCSRAESPGWFTVLLKTSAPDVMHKRVQSRCEAANHQLPIAAALWIILIVSAEECSSSTEDLMQIRCSAHSVILNAMATQHTCSLHSIYHPHWLVQWSHHCSHVRIPVHSPWLPGYIDVVQTVLVMLTMAGLFLDRPYISVLYMYNTEQFPQKSSYHVVRQ